MELQEWEMVAAPKKPNLRSKRTAVAGTLALRFFDSGINVISAVCPFTIGQQTQSARSSVPPNQSAGHKTGPASQLLNVFLTIVNRQVRHAPKGHLGLKIFPCAAD
jgi:hypothetical protein